MRTLIIEETWSEHHPSANRDELFPDLGVFEDERLLGDRHRTHQQVQREYDRTRSH